MPGKGLYIQFFSIHGLVRGHDLEMGRNADTGGQTKYIIELAKSLGGHPGVRKVDLFTRLIKEKTVSPDYGQQIEELDGNARIVRIRCGGSKYIRKELLWPHLDEYVDKTIRFIKNQGDMPDIVHGHYADAGYVVRQLAAIFGLPKVFTGHSLGRAKQRQLRSNGMTDEEINKQFRMDYRIEVEEAIIRSADLIIASTNQEVEKQYGLYERSPASQFSVIPPGIDLTRFLPFYDEPPEDSPESKNRREAQFFMKKELERFLTNPDKPLILALSRPERRKNIPGLVKAYGSSKELQAIANLAIFAGIRKDITTMDDNEREELTELLMLMDKFDLYGKLAIPKRHNFEHEVPELYRIAARLQGVFVNPAFYEGFGLTLIEAAGSGLPIVATDDGGPRDIIGNCHNGILIDVREEKKLIDALKKILVDPQLWKEYSQKGIEGVTAHYSWEAHCKKYMKEVKKLVKSDKKKEEDFVVSGAIGKRFSTVKKLFITDIDDTLLGDDDALQELLEHLQKNRDEIAFGVATGRTVESACEVLRENNVVPPDVIITSVGSEIYYGEKLLNDRGWRTHISAQWQREKIKSKLEALDFLELQEEATQREFKVSYYMQSNADNLSKVHHVLNSNRLRNNLIYSSDSYLDILPYRASKGKAIRYLSYKWDIPLQRILVAGDSGNDEDMLRGELRGVVVGNFKPDLEKLRGLKNIYFSDDEYAKGILDGFRHYRFITDK